MICASRREDSRPATDCNRIQEPCDAISRFIADVAEAVADGAEVRAGIGRELNDAHRCGLNLAMPGMSLDAAHLPKCPQRREGRLVDLVGQAGLIGQAGLTGQVRR